MDPQPVKKILGNFLCGLKHKFNFVCLSEQPWVKGQTYCLLAEIRDLGNPFKFKGNCDAQRVLEVMT